MTLRRADARARAERRCSHEVMVQCYLDYYRQLIFPPMEGVSA